ncbi:MAG: PLD nuclease N-terminal domain-containing protein [Pseudomonadota bacterium]
MELTSVAGIMVVLANLFGIVRTLRSTATGGNKVMWVAIILLLPFVGVVAWILFGPS